MEEKVKKVQKGVQKYLHTEAFLLLIIRSQDIKRS